MSTTTLYKIELITATDTAKEAGKRDLNNTIDECIKASRAGGYILDIHIVEDVNRRDKEMRDEVLFLKLAIAGMLGVLMWIMW